jgi:hypothetical protein
MRKFIAILIICAVLAGLTAGVGAMTPFRETFESLSAFDEMARNVYNEWIGGSLIVPIWADRELEHLPFVSITVQHGEVFNVYTDYGNPESKRLFFGTFPWILNHSIDHKLFHTSESGIDYYFRAGEENINVDWIRFNLESHNTSVSAAAYGYDTPEEALEDIKKFTFVRLDEVGAYAAALQEEEVEEAEVNPSTGVMFGVIPMIFAGSVAWISRRRM